MSNIVSDWFECNGGIDTIYIFSVISKLKYNNGACCGLDGFCYKCCFTIMFIILVSCVNILCILFYN